MEKLNTDTSNSVSTDLINKVIRCYFNENQFEDFLFDYISNMIIEEIPDNHSDLYNLIGDYLFDQLKYSETQVEAICKEIMEKLLKIGLKGQRKAIIAEKLNKSVKLGEVRVGSENTITSTSFDANALTVQKDKLYGAYSGIEEVREKKEVNEELRKHLEELKKAKEAVPRIIMHHDRDESHKVDIIIPAFTISIGGKTLMEDATLRISYGRRYVLVGRNGIGKTTLLNYLARKEIDGVPKHLQILHVEQEVVSNDNTLLQEVLRCDYERDQLLNKMNEINKKLGEVTETTPEVKLLEQELVSVSKRLQDIDADEAEAKAVSILMGLGFSNKDLHKKTREFSGGWRMRISLAKALFVQPDILLLDEPTNHLDMNAVMWLEDYLTSWPYTIVIVSHARDFIDNVATDVIHLQNAKLAYYKGNYSEFERARAERNKLMNKQRSSQIKEIERVQGFIDRFKANAKRASLVQSRIKALNRMEVIDEIIEDPTCIFVFPVPDRLNPPVLRLDNVDLGYGDNLILKKVNYSVDMSTRIAVVGPNGAGKTTLLKCLTNELAPKSGSVYRHNKLKLAMFTQHHIDQLDLELSPVEQLSQEYPNISQEIIRAHLSSFGITGNMALRPNYLLSGGQKTRVALAKLVYKNPHIILMDEPTNHLDIDAVNALSIALNGYNGGLVIVSHDQHFVESVCNQIYVVKDEKCTLFKGNFADYKKYLKSQQ